MTSGAVDPAIMASRRADGLAQLETMMGCATRREEARRAVLAQDCPFCGKSGYRVVAMHVWKAHGILRRELSDLLGFTYKERICSEEASAAISESQGPGFKGTLRKPQRPWKYSAAGIERNREAARLRVLSAGREWHAAGGRASAAAQRGKRKVPQRHGTVLEYVKYKCRCDLCKKAQSESNAMYRKKYGKDYWREKNRGYYAARKATPPE